MLADQQQVRIFQRGIDSCHLRVRVRIEGSYDTMCCLWDDTDNRFLHCYLCQMFKR